MNSAGILGLQTVARVVDDLPDHVARRRLQDVVQQTQRLISSDEESARMHDDLMAGRQVLIRTPEHALRFVALYRGSVASAGLSDSYDPIENEYSDLSACLGTCGLLALGHVYVWTHNCARQAVSLELPQVVVTTESFPVPHEYMVFVFGEGIVWGDVHCSVICLATKHDRSGLRFRVPMIKDGLNRISELSGLYRYGETPSLPPLRNTVWEAPLKMLSFVNSPYIPKMSARPGRPARRRAARIGINIDTEVTFLDLRSIRSGSRDNQVPGPPVDWKHHWIVRGHLRRVGADKRVVFIPPHLKGDLEKPLLDHVYKVKR